MRLAPTFVNYSRQLFLSIHLESISKERVSKEENQRIFKQRYLDLKEVKRLDRNDHPILKKPKFNKLAVFDTKNYENLKKIKLLFD